jgi:hypothetical protein
MIDKLYKKYVKSIAKMQDKAQMLLKTEDMEHCISTPIRLVNVLTPDHLLMTIEKSQNSGVYIFSDKIVVDFIHICCDPLWVEITQR